VQWPRSVEGPGQQGEIRLGELLLPPEQAPGDKEIGKKRRPEPCTRWYRAEFRSVGRRTIEHGTVAMMAGEKTRTHESEWRAVRATCYPTHGGWREL
jgi:hypothetical protein